MTAGSILHAACTQYFAAYAAASLCTSMHPLHLHAYLAAFESNPSTPVTQPAPAKVTSQEMCSLIEQKTLPVVKFVGMVSC